VFVYRYRLYTQYRYVGLYYPVFIFLYYESALKVFTSVCHGRLILEYLCGYFKRARKPYDRVFKDSRDSKAIARIPNKFGSRKIIINFPIIKSIAFRDYHAIQFCELYYNSLIFFNYLK
jgi:hypothetical protein